MPRGGKSGLQEHRRKLLRDFSVARDRLQLIENPSHRELQAFRACYQIFDFATGLKDQIWQYQCGRDIAEESGVEASLIDLLVSGDFGGSAEGAVRERQRTEPESPDFPSNPERVLVRVAATEPASSSAKRPHPSSSSGPVSSRRTRATAVLIQERCVEDAAQRLLENLGIEPSGHHSVCLLDFNGVINDSWYDSVRVLGDLKEHRVKVGVLSYCRSPSTVANTVQYLQELSETVNLDLPVVIAPRPVAKDCWKAGDWCKADLILELPISSRFTVAFIDDRLDICQDCTRQVTSPYFRAIQCSQGIVRALAEWTVSRKGTHYLDLTDIRTVRIS